MWVCSFGWIDDVIATPRVKSSGGRTARVTAPTSASELVRVTVPSRADSRGSVPESRIACSRVCVPYVPAAITT